MRLVDLDAKEPYLLDGRYAIGILDNAPTAERPKGDLISREALKKAFEDIQEVSECGKYVTDEMFELIDNAPTVERPQGRWVEDIEHTEHGQSGIMCSICKEHSMVHKNFCPNCGASMVRGDK